jgi:hypothetical protein
MITQHSYALGRDQEFDFVTEAGTAIQNKDVKSVNITFETSAEADVTTRGSGNESEYYPVRRNTQFEVVVLNHSALLHATGTVIVTALQPSLLWGGPPLQYPTGFGHFYVNSISEPQDNDGAIEFTITLRRTALFES